MLVHKYTCMHQTDKHKFAIKICFNMITLCTEKSIFICQLSKKSELINLKDIIQSVFTAKVTYISYQNIKNATLIKHLAQKVSMQIMDVNCMKRGYKTEYNSSTTSDIGFFFVKFILINI